VKKRALSRMSGTVRRGRKGWGPNQTSGAGRNVPERRRGVKTKIDRKPVSKTQRKHPGEISKTKKNV